MHVNLIGVNSLRCLYNPGLMSRSHHTFHPVPIEIDPDYVQKQILANHFSHYYSRRCRRLVSELASVVNP